MWIYRSNMGLQVECRPTCRMWAYRSNVGYELNVGLWAKRGLTSRMWVYRPNVGLRVECKLIGRMWVYRPNVGLRVRCGPTSQMWTYRPKMGLQIEWRHMSWIKAYSWVLTLWFCLANFVKDCPCDVSSGVTEASSLQKFWIVYIKCYAFYFLWLYVVLLTWACVVGWWSDVMCHVRWLTDIFVSVMP